MNGFDNNNSLQQLSSLLAPPDLSSTTSPQPKFTPGSIGPAKKQPFSIAQQTKPITNNDIWDDQDIETHVDVDPRPAPGIPGLLELMFRIFNQIPTESFERGYVSWRRWQNTLNK